MQARFRSLPARASTLAVAAATAAAVGVTAPAGAQDATSPWTQHGADGAQTNQGVAEAPSDPGLKWVLRLGEISTDDAPDGYSVGSAVAGSRSLHNQPLVSADGTLIMRADKNGVGSRDGGDVLLALDPEDGSVAWEFEGVTSSCGAAIDSQDRVWVSARGDELVALDASTGEEIDEGDRLEFDGRCRNVGLHVGGDDEHLVVFGAGQIEAIDISGDTPSSSWVLGTGADDAFDDILAGGPRRGVISDDTLIVPMISGEDEDATAELVSFALEDGEILERVDLPLPGLTTDDLGAVHLLLADDTLVVGADRSIFGDGDGYVAAFDSHDLSQQWLEVTEEESGPTILTHGAGVVHANDGNGYVTAYDLATGEAQWSDLDVIERGGSVRYTAISDADGQLITLTSVGDGSDARAVTLVDTDGDIQWQAPRAAIRQEADLTDEELSSGGSMYLGPIDADGTIYLYRGGTIVAIDDSGGLAAGCELPFEDVDADLNVHAANICRLVDEAITAGLTETTYGPGEPVSRQQMATFLTRALDLPTREGSDFPDVDPDSVHAPSINAILDAGITQGQADGTFGPTGALDRQQMATFLARAAGLDGVDGEGFDDVADDNVHAENIYAVRDAGITQGVSDSRFAPDRTVVRDQMASFLMRMVDFLDEEG
jgi:outer membrane protein assembly factor BamB